MSNSRPNKQYQQDEAITVFCCGSGTSLFQESHFSDSDTVHYWSGQKQKSNDSSANDDHVPTWQSEVFHALKGQKILVKGPGAEDWGCESSKLQMANADTYLRQTASELSDYFIKHILDKLSEDPAKPVKINLIGYSRGAILPIVFANQLYERMQKLGLTADQVELNIFGEDPVSGLFSKRHEDMYQLPPIIKRYTATVSGDMRLVMLPQVTRFKIMDPSRTELRVLPYIGDHSTSLLSPHYESADDNVDADFNSVLPKIHFLHLHMILSEIEKLGIGMDKHKIAFRFVEILNKTYPDAIAFKVRAELLTEKKMSPAELLEYYSDMHVVLSKRYRAENKSGLQKIVGASDLNAQVAKLIRHGPLAINGSDHELGVVTRDLSTIHAAYVPYNKFFFDAHHADIFKQQFPHVFDVFFENKPATEEYIKELEEAKQFFINIGDFDRAKILKYQSYSQFEALVPSSTPGKSSQLADDAVVNNLFKKLIQEISQVMIKGRFAKALGLDDLKNKLKKFSSIPLQADKEAYLTSVLTEYLNKDLSGATIKIIKSNEKPLGFVQHAHELMMYLMLKKRVDAPHLREKNDYPDDPEQQIIHLRIKSSLFGAMRCYNSLTEKAQISDIKDQFSKPLSENIKYTNHVLTELLQDSFSILTRNRINLVHQLVTALHNTDVLNYLSQGDPKIQQHLHMIMLMEKELLKSKNPDHIELQKLVYLRQSLIKSTFTHEGQFHLQKTNLTRVYNTIETKFNSMKNKIGWLQTTLLTCPDQNRYRMQLIFEQVRQGKYQLSPKQRDSYKQIFINYVMTSIDKNLNTDELNALHKSIIASQLKIQFLIASASKEIAKQLSKNEYKSDQFFVWLNQKCKTNSNDPLMIVMDLAVRHAVTCASLPTKWDSKILQAQQQILAGPLFQAALDVSIKDQELLKAYLTAFKFIDNIEKYLLRMNSEKNYQQFSQPEMKLFLTHLNQLRIELIHSTSLEMTPGMVAKMIEKFAPKELSMKLPSEIVTTFQREYSNYYKLQKQSLFPVDQPQSYAEKRSQLKRGEGLISIFNTQSEHEPSVNSIASSTVRSDDESAPESSISRTPRNNR